MPNFGRLRVKIEMKTLPDFVRLRVKKLRCIYATKIDQKFDDTFPDIRPEASVRVVPPYFGTIST